MPKTTSAVSRKVNQVGTRAAARTSARHHQAAAETETTGDVIHGVRAHIDAWVAALPLEAWRLARRWHDYTAAAGAGLVALLAIGILRLADDGTGPTRIAPAWLLATLIAGGFGWVWWHLHHAHAAKLRAAAIHAKPITNLLRPRPGVTGTFSDLDWRMLDELAVPSGHTAGQYVEKARVLSDSLKMPVRVTSPRPGIILVRRQLQDILARPVPWQVATDHLIPVGLDDDALWRMWDPLGMSLLVAGMKGSGKSAALKAILVNLLRQGHPVSLIDLEGGPNFGRFKDFAANLATTVPEALALLDHLNDEREGNLLKLNHPDAPDAAPRVSHVLVIDELAMLTHQSRDHSKQAREVLDDMLARGRKPAFTLIAATQYPETAVLPTLLRGQFTQILGLRTAHRPETNVILGTGALGEGWDLSAIEPHHQGRGLWWDGSTITPIRSAGLYGEPLRNAIRALTAQHRAVIDTASIPTPTIPQAATGDIQPPTPETEKQLTPSDIREMVAELARLAGVVGISVPAIAQKLSVSVDKVRRACQFWRDRDLMRTDGTRWYWTGEVA